MKRRHTVLLAEDDDNDVLLLKVAFERHGKNLELRVVNNGKDAKKYLSSMSPNDEDAPSILITDIKMAPGDGFYLLRWVRASPQWSDLPVLVLTASSLEEDRKRAMELGATAFLTKENNAATREFIKELHRWL